MFILTKLLVAGNYYHFLAKSHDLQKAKIHFLKEKNFSPTNLKSCLI